MIAFTPPLMRAVAVKIDRFLDLNFAMEGAYIKEKQLFKLLFFKSIARKNMPHLWIFLGFLMLGLIASCVLI
jgi:hypothetical protein